MWAKKVNIDGVIRDCYLHCTEQGLKHLVRYLYTLHDEPACLHVTGSDTNGSRTVRPVFACKSLIRGYKSYTCRWK